VDKLSREDQLARVTALAEDFLDFVGREEPDGFNLGVIGFVFEVLTERAGSDYLKRSDAGYTPDDDVSESIYTYCSDHRTWVKEKLFEEAYDIALYVPPRAMATTTQPQTRQTRSNSLRGLGHWPRRLCFCECSDGAPFGRFRHLRARSDGRPGRDLTTH
jgi:hypothetical protein